jgi:hypothetical protein
VEISDFEAGHGRQVRWQLKTCNATDPIRERWVGASWIIELVSTSHRDGKAFHQVRLYDSNRLRLHHYPTHQLKNIAGNGAAAMGHRKPVALTARHTAR